MTENMEESVVSYNVTSLFLPSISLANWLKGQPPGVNGLPPGLALIVPTK